MIQREHSAILMTCIKLHFVIKIFVLSNFEWPLKTGFIVYLSHPMWLMLAWFLLLFALCDFDAAPTARRGFELNFVSCADPKS